MTSKKVKNRVLGLISDCLDRSPSVDVKALNSTRVFRKLLLRCSSMFLFLAKLAKYYRMLTCSITGTRSDKLDQRHAQRHQPD